MHEAFRQGIDLVEEPEAGDPELVDRLGNPFRPESLLTGAEPLPRKVVGRERRRGRQRDPEQDGQERATAHDVPRIVPHPGEWPPAWLRKPGRGASDSRSSSTATLRRSIETETTSLALPSRARSRRDNPGTGLPRSVRRRPDRATGRAAAGLRFPAGRGVGKARRRGGPGPARREAARRRCCGALRGGSRRHREGIRTRERRGCS